MPKTNSGFTLVAYAINYTIKSSLYGVDVLEIAGGY